VTKKMSETTIHLVSSEGDSFALPLVAAKLSELVKTMLDEEAEDADDIQEIPLPNVKSTVLALVIEFLRHQTVEPMNDIEKVRDEKTSGIEN
jgi:S-phase kinase-associated protein 1